MGNATDEGTFAERHFCASGLGENMASFLELTELPSLHVRYGRVARSNPVHGLKFCETSLPQTMQSQFESQQILLSMELDHYLEVVEFSTGFVFSVY